MPSPLPAFRDVGGIRCDGVLALLPDVVEGAASPADTARVHAHLAGCDVCERFGGAYASLVTRVRAAPAPDAGVDDLLARLDAALDAAK